MSDDPVNDCAGVRLSPALQRALDDAAAHWRNSSTLVEDYVRQAMLAEARAADAAIAHELVGEAHQRMRHDPVLRARVDAVRQVLLADERPAGGRGHRPTPVSGAEQFAAALALIVAEQLPLPGASQAGAVEALAVALWDSIGAPGAGKSWLQLAIDGNTATQASYRAIAGRLLTALTAAGYRLLSGAEEIPHE